MRGIFSIEGLSPRRRSLLAVSAVLLGVIVGALALFEKPIVKAAADFFSAC